MVSAQEPLDPDRKLPWPSSRKPPLEQGGLEDEVEVRAEPGSFTTTPVVSPRAGWAEAVLSKALGVLREMFAA